MPQVPPSNYGKRYDNRYRLYTYAEQLSETLRLGADSAIEVGVGSGFLSRNLRAAGMSLMTVDFDPQLRPDIAASVTSLPLPDGAAEVSLCFQVLEHLPFEQFPAAVRELSRVSSRWVFLSLPDPRHQVRLAVSNRHQWIVSGWALWKRKVTRWPGQQCSEYGDTGWPLWPLKLHRFDGQHYWEIGKPETPLPKVLEALRQSGLALQRHYRLYLDPRHHYFLLEKR